jgi:hypothetical protein
MRAEGQARGGFRGLPLIAPWDFQWPGGTAPETAERAGADAQIDTLDARRLALASERRSHACCAAIAAATTDPELRAIAGGLAAGEARHVVGLECPIANRSPAPPAAWAPGSRRDHPAKPHRPRRRLQPAVAAREPRGCRRGPGHRFVDPHQGLVQRRPMKRIPGRTGALIAWLGRHAIGNGHCARARCMAGPGGRADAPAPCRDTAGAHPTDAPPSIDQGGVSCNIETR